MYYEFFPEIFIQLQLEIQRRHPRLIQRLQKHDQLELGVIFAEIASYCSIGLNDTFDEEMLEALAEILLGKLQAMASPMQAEPKFSEDFKKEKWKFRPNFH